MFTAEFLQRAIIALPAILFALTVHEFFHAYIAFRFGDTTARDMGRLTLNPLAHLDLMGTLMLFLSQFRFGWAKPVPVNLMNIRDPRKASFWISAAGPLSNLGLALIFGTLLRIANTVGLGLPEAVSMFLVLSVIINVSLAFFNLIPLSPLDGSHILRSVLPAEHGQMLDRIQPYSPFILLGLIFTGITWIILGPFISFFISLFTGMNYG